MEKQLTPIWLFLRRQQSRRFPRSVALWGVCELSTSHSSADSLLVARPLPSSFTLLFVAIATGRCFPFSATSQGKSATTSGEHENERASKEERPNVVEIQGYMGRASSLVVVAQSHWTLRENCEFSRQQVFLTPLRSSVVFWFWFCSI